MLLEWLIDTSLARSLSKGLGPLQRSSAVNVGALTDDADR